VDLHLSERRALLTGSTAGIEAAIARQLASEGVAVVVHGRDEQRGQRLAAELTGAGRRAIFIGADLARPVDITRLASQRVRRLAPSYGWTVGVTPGRPEAHNLSFTRPARTGDAVDVTNH
jgi:NAD(P)-dependent dehydrogenase (short-subunit alcohol dehydrogenase family)